MDYVSSKSIYEHDEHAKEKIERDNVLMHKLGREMLDLNT